jgi:hypothetical protein
MHRGEGTLTLTCDCECAFPDKGIDIVHDCCPRKLNTLLLLLEIVEVWGMKAFTSCVEWKAKRKNDTHVHDTHTAVGDENITVTGRDLASDFSAI